MDKDKIKQGVTLLLEGIGEDIDREGLIDTPDRIARMYEEIFAGLEQTAAEPLSKVFTAQNTDILFHVRTSSASFLRQSAYRVYS